MIAFEVFINGVKLYTVNAQDMGWLTAHLTRERQLPDGEIKTYLSAAAANFYSDGGIEHTKWTDHPLSVGDEITMRIIETEDMDTPERRVTPNPEQENWITKTSRPRKDQ